MANFNKLIEDFFNQPIPRELWHYTTLEGCRGILFSQSIWATEARFTTDPTEFVNAQQFCLDFLGAIKPDSEDAEHAIRAARNIVESAFGTGMLSPGKIEVFVASFSSSRDRKSQWLGYADNARGVSLNFDLINVRPPSDLNLGIAVAPCIYYDGQKEKLLRAALSHYVDTTMRLWSQTSDIAWVKKQLHTWKLLRSMSGESFSRQDFDAYIGKQIRKDLHQAYAHSCFDLLRIASLCKHESYHEENEWRISLPHLKSKPMEHNVILYRGREQNIPYIEFNLSRGKKRLPVTEVMAGYQCPNLQVVRDALIEFDFKIPLSKSEIPYRKPEDIR